MSNLYKTRVNAYGGRSGTIRSEDGILDMPLALPKELGGKGGATNPEQLFAAGYAATRCATRISRFRAKLG